jgi:hypothetical protein
VGEGRNVQTKSLVSYFNKMCGKAQKVCGYVAKIVGRKAWSASQPGYVRPKKVRPKDVLDEKPG